MLNDGYGDALTPDEVLQDYDGWLHRRAYSMLPLGSPDHDDLAQEGRIAMWEALGKHDASKGALPSWLTTHATWHMKEMLTRKRWTGMPSRQHGSTPLPRDEPISLTKMMDDIGSVHELLVAADLTDAMLLAYHQGEIAQALDALTPQQRKYVFLRFWAGFNETQMINVFGYRPNGLWNSVKNGAKYKLRKRLAHLMEV